MYWQYLLSVMGCIFSLIALLLALNANRRFTGVLKRFVEWTTLGIGYIFMVSFLSALAIMVSLFGVEGLEAFLRAINLVIFLAASLCFIQAALFLLHVSHVYGFSDSPFTKKLLDEQKTEQAKMPEDTASNRKSV